jgi:CRISPR system Cascade subunit CasE
MIDEPMTDAILAHASVLLLSREDIKMLKVKDAYALHKVVYGLFEDVRSEAEKAAGKSSGILYADKGGDFNTRQILLLSNRKPHQTPQFGQVKTSPILTSFANHAEYAFEITINPVKRDNASGKIIGIRGREEIQQWFMQRASDAYGFKVNPASIQIEQISVQTFEKSSEKSVQIITHGSATIKGQLIVTDREIFVNSFTQGLGRGKSFGFGLLQIVPLQTA